MHAFPSYLVGRNLPEPIRTLEAAGSLTDAEREIDHRLAVPALVDPATAKVLTLERERLHRLRRDFSVTPEAMLQKLRSSVPDATAEELDNLRRDGFIQWAPIDGQIRYFRREPVNLFRFDEGMKKRRDAAKPKAEEKPTSPSAQAKKVIEINDHAAEIVATVAKTGQSQVLPIHSRVRHTLRVTPGVVPEGKTLRCWIPYPQEYRQQGDVRFLSSSPEKHQIAPNGSPHRTIYLEQPAPPAGHSATFQVEYEYTVSSYAPTVDLAKVQPVDPKDPALKPSLGEQPPHLLLTPEVRRLAKDIVGDETNPYCKAEKIFRWMNDNIRYVSEMEYAIIPSVSEKVLATRRGDCGAQVLVFLALCRASGVPARWQSGWENRPGGWNLHDWAEFYVAPYGWLPADPSFGLRNVDDPQVRDFYFGHLDSLRMIANLDFDAPFLPAKTFWRSDPVDSQRGEVEWEGGNLYYDDWSYEVDIEYLDK